MSAMLATKGLTKHFGGLRALSDVTISVEPGEIHAIIGPNGAGKSTCLNVLTGLLQPTSGEIRFKDRDITGSRPHEVSRMGISRIFQNGKVFRRLTVLENVMIGGHCRLQAGIKDIVLSTRRFRAEQAALMEQSLAMLARFGLQDAANRAVTSLSYGRQRLVELSRALVSQPELLLLDEPAAGLNSAEAEELMRLLQGLRQQNLTIVLIEHNMGLVMRLADRISVLNFGEKLAEGTPQEIQSNPTVLQAYLGKGYKHVAV